MQPSSLSEKIQSLQSETIKRQEREINELRESKQILEATNRTLAEALANALSREGRDRVFVPLRDIKPSGTEFHIERTIGGDLLIVRC